MVERERDPGRDRADGELAKVGRLAHELGLTVRTLHHYDALGLVSPSARTTSGHRLYAPEDVRRLYQVLALRQLGLHLDEIAEVLAGRSSLTSVLAAHQDHLDGQLRALVELRDQLTALRGRLEEPEPPSYDDFLDLIRKVVMVDKTVQKHFDPEQLADLEQRHQADPEAAQRVVQGWAELLPRVDAAIADGTDPSSPVGQELARRWNELLAAFHQGDDGLRQGLFALQAENAERIERDHGGPSAAQLAFISAANRVGG